MIDVATTGIEFVAVCAACKAGVALAIIKSTLSDTNVFAIVAQVGISPDAFSIVTFTLSPNFSTRAALKPSVAASSAGCCTS